MKAKGIAGFVQLLGSKAEMIRGVAAWGLGSIAGESVEYRYVKRGRGEEYGVNEGKEMNARDAMKCIRIG